MSHTVAGSTQRSSLSSWLAALQADQLACRLATESVRVLLPLAKVCAVFIEREVWRAVGYSSLHDFSRERLERSSRWVRMHAALHRAVVALPELRDAVAGGDGGAPIGMCKALLVARVATSETLATWVDRARQVTVEQLQKAVREPADEGVSPQCDAVEEKVPVPIVDDDIPAVPGVLWVIPAPPAVRAAFDAALDLYRRVEGGEATVTSFIEALVAEEYASGCPPDVFQRWLHAVEPPSQPAGPPSGLELPAITVARETLATLDDVVARAGEGSDSEVLAQLQWFATAADLMERQLAALLVEMSASQALRELGFASVGAYAENRLGLCRTTIEDRVRAARALAKRPRLQQAYVSGAIGLEKALIASQILGPGYVERSREEDWAAHLKQCTVKRLRDERRALLFATAVEGRVEAPAPLTDDAWLASLRCAPGDTAVSVQRAGRVACSDGALIPIAGSVLRLRLPAELARDFSGCLEGRCHFLTIDAEACDWSQPLRDEDPASWRAARRV